MKHSRQDVESEKECDAVTTYAVGYMYMTEGADLITKKEVKHMEQTGQTSRLGRPILVAADRLTGAVFGNQVRCKGSSATWAVMVLRDNLYNYGYGGARVRLRSDQKPAIKDVMMNL